MKRRLLASVLALTLLVGLPSIARASSSSDDEDQVQIDGRLDGYKEGNMALKDAGGSGLTWLLLVVLGAMCVGVMFMNSKRSHLD
jgi:hypothetical protein